MKAWKEGSFQGEYSEEEPKKKLENTHVCNCEEGDTEQERVAVLVQFHINGRRFKSKGNGSVMTSDSDAKDDEPRKTWMW